MTYTYRVLQDNPIGMWPMNANFTVDYSGYSNFIARKGGLVVLPIVARGVASVQLTGTDSFSYPLSSFMIKGRAVQPFSFEAWVKVDVSGAATLFARNSSGIFINGNTLTFTLDMGSPVVASWDGLRPGNNYHIVAVYDTESVYLYINGEVVAIAPVVTENILADFKDTTSTISTKPTGATFSIDSVAVYLYPLSAQMVESHYQVGTDYPSVENIGMANSASMFSPWDGDVTTRDRVWVESDGWLDGDMLNVTVEDGELVNLWDETNQQYLDGAWTYSLTYEPEELTLVGSKLVWDSNQAVKMEFSRDGESWTEISNYSQPFTDQSLSNGFDFFVRLSLTGGAQQTAVKSLEYVTYIDKSILGSDVDSPAEPRDDTLVLSSNYFNPAEFNETAGVYFDSLVGGLEIKNDSEFNTVSAVEFWIMLGGPNAGKTIFSASGASLSLNTNGGWVSSGLSGLYIDGVSQSLSGSSTVALNTPHHVIITFANPITTSLFIANSILGNSGLVKARIGYVGLYINPIAASDAISIFKAWVGAAATQITDSTGITFSEGNYTETGSALRGYAYDWSISSSG